MKRAEWDTLTFFYGIILCVDGTGNGSRAMAAGHPDSGCRRITAVDRLRCRCGGDGTGAGHLYVLRTPEMLGYAASIWVRFPINTRHFTGG
jgi:hypothetical protein